MFNRRDFLQEGLALVSLGAAVPSVFSKAVVGAAEERYDLSLAGKTLVIVQLAGGLDGVNTIIPYADPAYRSNRPNLGVAEAQLLPVDDRIAFHSGIRELKEIYDEGAMAVVEGVGYPNPNFSHFRAMDIWQSADPEGDVRDGWLGRYFDGLTDRDGHPLAGLSVGRTLPAAFESQESTVPAVENLAQFGLQAPAGVDADQRQTSLLRLYEAYKPAKSGFAALLDTTLDNAYASSVDLKAASAAYRPAVTYPNSSLASGLRLLAELIHSNGAAESPLRVGHVSLGGFDTHTQQVARLQTLMRDFSQSLSAFWRDIVAHGHGEDVLVMTWSEFGRRVRENAQNGTDHGSAGPMFLLGNAVKGGFYGEPPSLTSLDNGNLRYTTDFRSVYATVLERWLQAPADTILGRHFEPLNLLV